MRSFYPPARIVLCIALLFGAITGRSQETMRAQLYVVTPSNGNELMDGNLTIYNNIYSNQVDWDDARKMTNMGENFAIIRSNTNLVVERRTLIQQTDTTYFKMWNMQQRQYRIGIWLGMSSHPGMIAQLVDNYLQTTIPVSLTDTTWVTFAVNADPLSAQQQRYKLIFNTPVTALIPVTFTKLAASRKQDRVLVQFNVANETNMELYEVQRASDGIHFSTFATVKPSCTGLDCSYSAWDEKPGTASVIYYRVKGISRGGKEQLTDVARIWSVETPASIHIFPNPVISKTVHWQSIALEPGLYKVHVYTQDGREVLSVQEEIIANDQQHDLLLPKNLSPGIYRMVVEKGGRQRISISISVR
jgi:hypothetical protein